jgi:hypothetical protein
METVWSIHGTLVLEVDQLPNITYFLEQLSMSYIHEIWFPDGEHSKVFKSMFVLCLYATHSFIFVIDAKLVPRRQTYPNTMVVFTARTWSCVPSAAQPKRQYRCVLMYISLTVVHVYCTERLTSLPSWNFSDEFLLTK